MAQSRASGGVSPSGVQGVVVLEAFGFFAFVYSYLFPDVDLKEMNFPRYSWLTLVNFCL